MCTKKPRITLNKRNYLRTNNRDLQTPTVTLAFDDGLLPITALNAPLEVTFPLWGDAALTHNYQLYWDGEAVGELKDVIQEDLDNPT